LTHDFVTAVKLLGN